MNESIETRRTIARARLGEAIQRGVENAGPVIQRVLAQVPEDSIVEARYLRPIVNVDGSLSVTMSKNPDAPGRRLHEHAATQLHGRLNPKFNGFASEMGVPDVPKARKQPAVDNSWRRDLYSHNLRELLAHSKDRMLVRSVNDEIRGVLSDTYKRLDTRPLLDAFIATCNEIGAVPYEGVASDLRVSVRAFVPTIFEPSPGESMVFGLSWNNSDFGAGSYGITAFALRLVCLNGMVGASELRQVHLGSRLPDDLELSQATYAKETKYMESVTRDITRKLLSPKALGERQSAIIDAVGREVDVVQAIKSLGKSALTKSETEKVSEVFERGDTAQVPEGKNRWRFSNALSWVAKTATPARAIELQEMAGKFVGLDRAA